MKGNEKKLLFFVNCDFFLGTLGNALILTVLWSPFIFRKDLYLKIYPTKIYSYHGNLIDPIVFFPSWGLPKKHPSGSPKNTQSFCTEPPHCSLVPPVMSR